MEDPAERPIKAKFSQIVDPGAAIHTVFADARGPVEATAKGRNKNMLEYQLVVTGCGIVFHCNGRYELVELPVPRIALSGSKKKVFCWVKRHFP